MEKSKTLREAFPEIAAEWHPVKNGSLTPDMVAPFSNRKVWWRRPYDDVQTGRHFDFEWQAMVFSRTKDGRGCPYLSGQAVWPGYNDLKTTHPSLAAEWHPTKNGSLTPEMVAAGSSKKVWWLLNYTDPDTGRYYAFEWSAVIYSRAKDGRGCPYLSGQAVWPGFNDLCTTNPEIAGQWHPALNGDMTPERLTAMSHYMAWWLYPYEDPETGEHHDFVWKSTVYNRTRGSSLCPYLSGKSVKKGFNDLASTRPDIASQWHPEKNGNMTPQRVTVASTYMAWWLFPYDDPSTGEHHDFEWQQEVRRRTEEKASECPFLTGQKIWLGFNDLATTHPHIAAQWHPSKNGSLTPEDVSAGSTYMAWWLFPYDDPSTGEHHDFEWQQKVSDRTREGASECPFLTGQKIWLGFNDLATTHPHIAAQWHPSKNGSLTPKDVSAGSHTMVWWFLPYDDPVTGRHFDFEWQQKVSGRTMGGMSECPFLSGQRLCPGFNDLRTTHPHIAAQWHPTKNGSLTPEDVSAGRDTRVWWYYPYDDPVTGKHYDFEWQQDICARTFEKASECPFLTGHMIWRGFNDLKTTHPHIAAQWHPTKNGSLTPEDVTAGSNTRVWWFLPYDDPVTGRHFDFEWETAVVNRTSGEVGCPYLTNSAVWPGFNDLATHYPELAAQWHPTKNYGLTPDKVLAGGGQWGWWIYPYDDPETGKHYDFVWLSTVSNRINNPACPFLKNKGVWTGYNDLQTCFPEIAAQWHPERNRTTPDKVMKYSHKNVWWKCEHGHEWRTSVASRTKRGTGCPKCNKIRRRYGIWTD